MIPVLRVFCLLTLLVAGLCSGGADGHASEVRSGLSFRSEALGGPMTYSLYLPDGHDPGAGPALPAVYLLHGYGANDREWIELGRVAGTLDGLIANGDIPPLIAVMPFAAKGWYVDSADIGGPGNFETAIVSDLAAHVERTYGAMTNREGRFIAGLSMGGYGALRLAFFHPERYAAAVSLSGALYEDVGIPAFEGPITPDAEPEAEKWYLGAYGRPFDPDRYRRLSPFARIPALAAMQSPPRIMIMTGDDDFFRFYEGSADLFAALRQAGIPSEFRAEDGGHDWTLWRAQIPQMMQFLTSGMPQ